MNKLNIFLISLIAGGPWLFITWFSFPLDFLGFLLFFFVPFLISISIITWLVWKKAWWGVGLFIFGQYVIIFFATLMWGISSTASFLDKLLLVEFSGAGLLVGSFIDFVVLAKKRVKKNEQA